MKQGKDIVIGNVLAKLLRGSESVVGEKLQIERSLHEVGRLLIIDLVESYPLDAKRIKEAIKLARESGIELTNSQWSAIGRNIWYENFPNGAESKISADPRLRESEAFKFYNEIIDELGIKIKTAMSGLICVSAKIPPVCADCYFAEICTLKK
jgi:hypothetical protein